MIVFPGLILSQQTLHVKSINLDNIMGEENHLTADMIADVIIDVLNEYEISDKAKVFVSGRGSDMVAAARIISEKLGHHQLVAIMWQFNCVFLLHQQHLLYLSRSHERSSVVFSTTIDLIRVHFAS